MGVCFNAMAPVHAVPRRQRAPAIVDQVMREEPAPIHQSPLHLEVLGQRRSQKTDTIFMCDQATVRRDSATRIARLHELTVNVREAHGILSLHGTGLPMAAGQ